MVNWKDAAIKYGYRSSIAFPFIIENGVVNILTMYAPKVDFFTDDELQLLVRVTNNINYALNAINNNKKRIEAEVELNKFKNIVDNSVAYIGIANLNKDVFYLNNSIRKRFAIPEDADLTKLKVYDMYSDKGKKIVENAFIETHEKGFWRGENEMMSFDGTIIPIMHTIILIKDRNGIPQFTSSIAIDISLQKETETQLRKITLAIEQSSASIVITNLKSEIEYVNPAFTEITGYSFEEAIGKNPRILKSGLTPSSTFTELWENLTNKIPWHGELCNKKKSGEIFWEQAVISPITDEYGKVTNYVSVKENITEKKKIEVELKKSVTELRELANHLSTIREEERSDIAKEIHDELSQNLVAISMNAAHLKNKINDPSVKAIVEEQITISNDAVKTSKELFNSLHPFMLDELGLEAAIKWYAKTKLKSSAIQFEFRTNINIGNDNISKQINLGFFRIYQETLSNILRHAKATVISVELNKTKENLFMRIKDNGLGFDVDKIDTLNHHGILGIRERALAMDGEFIINSATGEGTTVQVKVKI